MFRKQLSFFVFSSLVVASSMSVQAPSWAADDNSPDSMWIDQEAPTIGGSDDKTKGAVASLHGGTAPAIVAPMCGLADFKASALVSKVAWPGVGPFKNSDSVSSEFIDDGQNRLKLGLSAEQVSSAELGLTKMGTGGAKDFLDIEMTADFLLEALGAKPRKIAEFNTQLEKNKEAVRKGRNISLAAGRYQVTIERGKSAAPYSCLIAVNSLDAHKSLIKEHSGTDETPDETTAKTETPMVKRLADLVKKPSLPKVKPPVATPTATTTASTSTATASTGDAKKDEFVNTIKSWQQVKKTALKKRDVTHLTEILGGNALAKQSTAVKWLQDHQKYYDMEPRGCIVDKYTDLGGGKKFSVVAQVREFSKYIDETSNNVLKEVDDKYTVNYTIEKQGNKWIIMDSSVITSASQGPVKPGAAKPNR